MRDTWEITPDQVTLGGKGWDAKLALALEQLGTQLGLPQTARLQAELHSMLVYGKGQFFAPHQDSEKHDNMVATLVVSLPSAHSGGELVIDDQGTLKQYKGSADELVLVAFYADRRHEVLPVDSGHRVTLTFNLLLETGTVPAPHELIDDASALLREHFTTPTVTSYGYDRGVPQRLAFLLDHEYSQHGLKAGQLKGADAQRVAILSSAARTPIATMHWLWPKSKRSGPLPLRWILTLTNMMTSTMSSMTMTNSNTPSMTASS